MFPNSIASMAYFFADQFVDILTKGLSTLLFRRLFQSYAWFLQAYDCGGMSRYQRLCFSHLSKRIENIMVSKFVNIVRQLLNSVTAE